MESKEYWKKYEAGIQYNSSFKSNKDYYEAVKVWHNFYDGDQWVGVPSDANFPKVEFNVIRRVCDFKIASITSTNTSVNVEPLEYQEPTGELTITDFVNAEIKNIFEKWNFQRESREALRKACIGGDMCAFLYFNPNAKPFRSAQYSDAQGEIELQIISGTDVYFGNANIKDVEKQPYIIISGRDTVKNLKEEAKKDIEADNDTEHMSSDYGDTEVEIDGDNEGKARYIYYFTKKNGKVFVTKCTKDCVIYENIDMNTTRYPIAFENWYTQDNTYHGRGEVEGMCNNQMALNKMVALLLYNQTMTAFPTAYYDSQLIDGFTNEVGSAIAIDGMNGKSIHDILGYITPTSMAEYNINAIDLTMNYTKDCMGVSDASLGNVKPENTSAIIATQKATAVPLENVRTNYYAFVEQIVMILLDMMANKYGVRPIVITNEEGHRQVVPFDFNQLNGIDLHLSIDIGDGSYYSEIVTNQTLDNLLNTQQIDFLEYLERVPQNVIPKKAELISKLKGQQQGAEQTQMIYQRLSEFMQTLPPEYQASMQQYLQDV